MDLPVQSHPWYHQKHHNAKGGFYNLQGATRDVSPVRAARWLIRHWTQKKDNQPPKVHAPSPSKLAAPPDSLRISWIGHATTLIQTPTANILTDPNFSRLASPLPFAGPKRFPELPIQLDELPPIDVVLLSHDHYDHLDRSTIQQLNEAFQPTFLVPLGVERRLEGWGVKTVASLDWWQYVDVAAGRLHATPARHFSGRGFLDRNKTLWCGWYFEPSDEVSPTVYFAGDTAFADHFSNVRLHLGAPEVAILPIGAYSPQWFMGLIHMDPQQAWQAFDDLKASAFVPIHWGTFDLAEETLQEPIEKLRALADAHEGDGRLHELPIGGAYEWEAAATDTADTPAERQS